MKVTCKYLMKRVLTIKSFQKAIATLMALFLFTFVSFPVHIHIHHDANTGEHITDFHQDLANHFHADTHSSGHIAGNLADDMHVIDGETSFIIKKLSNADSQPLVAILCVLLLVPLLLQVTGRLPRVSSRFIPLRSHFNNPPLRAPPVHS
ncbi:MAG: hypothetical protein RIC37_00650 [Gammaproteobacteria bacterium]